MFTGIISDTTAMNMASQDETGMTLTFKKPKTWQDLKLGESISTNGVCLTVSVIRDNEYDCVAIPETLDKTTFGHTLPGQVNLERAMQLNARLDGHFVQGHVDGIGKVVDIKEDDGRRLSIEFNESDRELVIYKGSITVDGVSLTVAQVDGNVLQVAVIPFTLTNTTLHLLKVGDSVNLEFDVIGKYIVNSLKVSSDKSQL